MIIGRIHGATRLRDGQPIYLSVYGTSHPPVALWIPEFSNQESKG